VEALRAGSWWPAVVLSVAAPSSKGGTIDSTTAADAGNAVGGAIKAAGEGAAGGGGADGSSIVVLQNMAPPESDGQVWRCSTGHAMRWVSSQDIQRSVRHRQLFRPQVLVNSLFNDNMCYRVSIILNVLPCLL
jgi:hypothetical protein